MGARWSEYYRAEFLSSQIAPFITMMKSTIGVKTEVAKQREVVVTGRTRIHLDQVAGLGHFIELETVVDSEDGADRADTELSEIAGMLGLGAYPAVAGSYSDLMEGNERT
jgi:predicted adenylyl cyclase CyaB